MGARSLIRIVLMCVLTTLIALFRPIKTEARETYISEEIIEICDKYGEQYDIDVYLLIAIIECESSGNPSVISANGQYIGLMQLNKDTFTGDLFDADNNVQQGAKYIDTLRTRHNVNAMGAYSYFCGESGRWGFYTRKVLNHYFELFCEGALGMEEKTL